MSHDFLLFPPSAPVAFDDVFPASPAPVDIFAGSSSFRVPLGSEGVPIEKLKRDFASDDVFQRRAEMDEKIAELDARPHDCSYKWAGVVPPHKRALDTCDAPVWFRCVYCPAQFQGNCKSTDESKCAKCEARYRSRVRVNSRIPLAASLPGTTFLITMTAPGARRHCLAHTYKDKKGIEQPSMRCDFSNPACVECPCSVNRVETRGDISDFNFSLAKRFNKYMTYMRRFSPDGVTGRGNKAARPFADFQYFKAIEPQKRGALHIHILMRSRRPFVMSPAVVNDLKMLALELGFGHQFDVQSLGTDLDAVTAARYVAKYVSKRNAATEVDIPFPRFVDVKKHHKQLDEVYKGGGAYCYAAKPETIRKKVKQPRAWTASRLWGLTMAKIAAQQKLYLSDKAAASKLMNYYIWDVWAFQLGVRHPFKPILALTAG